MRFFISFILSICFGTAVLAEIDFKNHIIVVIDNSGTVFDQDDYSNWDRFYAARRQLVEQLGDDYSREDYITVISVARSQVVWQGSASRIDKRRFNGTLMEYLNKEIGGCASFQSVMKTIGQQKRINPLPISEVIVMSSLVETGAYPCELDENNILPPQSFYDGLAELIGEEGAKVKLLWVEEDVYDHTLEYFLNKNMNVPVKRIQETILELSR